MVQGVGFVHITQFIMNMKLYIKIIKMLITKNGLITTNLRTTAEILCRARNLEKKS